MPERSIVATTTQIGVETTPGTAVAATKQLHATQINIDPSVEFDKFRPEGNKFNTLVSPTQEWVEGDITGRVAFNDLSYLLSGLLTTTTPTQIMDGGTPTGAYTWVFTPASSASDTPKTFTVERGSSVRAHRAPHVMINELSMSYERDGGPEIGGSVFGQRLEDAITMTASPTNVEPVPALITGTDVFLDTTSAALGTTKLTRLRSCEWSLGDRFNPVWVIDSSKPSFVAYNEQAVSATFDVTLEADTQGMGLLTPMRAGDTRFVRLRSLGPSIYTGGVSAQYSMIIDMAVKVGDIGDFDDDDGLMVFDWTFDLVHDSTWAKALQVTVINTQPSL